MLKDLNRGFTRGGQNKSLGHRALRAKSWSKRGPRSYYKGRGARSLGSINSKGRFQYDPEKLPVFVVPDLEGFDLKPYVSHNTPKIKVKVPQVPALDLQHTEVNILDIIAPHHKKLRAEKVKKTEKASRDAEKRAAAELLRQEEEQAQKQKEEEEENREEQGDKTLEAEIVNNERKEKEARE